MKRFLLAITLLTTSINAATAPKELFIIDFFTQKGNVTPHGTLSLIDQVPRSTWTTQTDLAKTTYDTRISEDDFRGIWDRISSLSDLAEFVSSDPKQKLSFTDHYIIGISFSLPGSQGMRLYWIPHDWAHLR